MHLSDEGNPMTILNTLSSFFISDAYADTGAAASAQAAGNFSFMILIGFFLVIMFFGVWRPQSKRAKEQRDLLSSLSKGDEVVTAGGILGKIAKVTDNYIVLTLSENVEITIQKSSIVGALPKGTLKSI